MDGDSKKPLKIVITDFYKLHKAKGKEYTFKQFKKFGVHKATIYRWLKKIEQNGNCDRKSGSGTGKDESIWQTKMGYKAFRKFEMNHFLTNFYVCNLILSEN